MVDFSFEMVWGVSRVGESGQLWGVWEMILVGLIVIYFIMLKKKFFLIWIYLILMY